MYHGKRQIPNKKSGTRKKSGILILCLVLLLVAAVGTTFAYLLDVTGILTNTFNPAEVKITIDEKTTETTKSDIKFTNPNAENAVPVYIRATLAISWTDTVDETTQPVPAPNGAKVEGGEVLTANGWFEVNGIYYYAAPVAPGETTSVMLDTITVTVPAGSTATCNINVLAEAIQATPTDAVTESWTDVTVGADGKLAAKTSA